MEGRTQAGVNTRLYVEVNTRLYVEVNTRLYVAICFQFLARRSAVRHANA